jgi:hypothetical protein
MVACTQVIIVGTENNVPVFGLLIHCFLVKAVAVQIIMLDSLPL